MLRDEGYLLDMRLAARDVLEFTSGVAFERFAADKMMQYAVVRGIQIIGEAARKISDEYAAAHPEVPWGRSAGCATDSFTSTRRWTWRRYGESWRLIFRKCSDFWGH